MSNRKKQLTDIIQLRRELCQLRSTQWWTALDNPLQTFTGFTVQSGSVAMVTGAFVGAVQIDTAAVEADSGEHTLIHIWKQGSDSKESEAQ